MEQKILDFNHEIFRYQYPEIQFYPDTLEITIGTGAKAAGSFKVSLGEGRKKEDEKIRGYFTCTDHRMKVEPLTFHAQEGEVRFTFDGSFLKKGELHEGELFFISTHGEYRLPYCVRVEEEELYYQEKKIASPEDFVALAKEDYAGAVSLFFNERFSALLLKENKKADLIRKGLLFSTDRFHALEEFLCYCGKKEQVHLTPAKGNYEYHVSGKAMRYQIPVRKNTWGYIRAKISVDCPAVTLVKEELLEKDFLGNSYELEFVIEPKLLTESRRKVTLTISDFYEEHSVTLLLLNMDAGKMGLYTRKRNTAKLRTAIEAFYQYRLHSISLEEMSTSVRMGIYDRGKEELREESLYIRAYLDYLSGEKEEVSKLMKENERWEKTPLAGVFHTYLSFLLAEEKEKPSLKHKMEDLAENFGVPEAYFFILQMEEDFKDSPAKKLALLSKLHQAGMNRSFLYFEVWLLFCENEDLFTKIDVLSLRAFSKALRHGMSVSTTLMKRFAEAAQECREYHPVVISVLKMMYEKEKREEFLLAILSQFLKAEKIYPDTHSFMRKGVTRGVKLTGIFELYAKSLREGDEIDPTVYTYFLYGDALHSGTKAVLYSYLIRNKEKREYREIYGKYREKIRSFALEELKDGELDENLLILYKEEMKERGFIKEAGKSLSEILYKQAVKVKEPRFRYLVVVHEELKKPEHFKITDRLAYSNVLSSSELFLSDQEGRLFVADEGLQREKLFSHENYVTELFANGDRGIFTLLELVKNTENKNSKSYFESIFLLRDSELLEERIRYKAKKAVADYYVRKHDPEKLQEIMEEVSFLDYEEDGEDLAKIILEHRLLPHYTQAIRYLGIKNTDSGYLEQLLSAHLHQEIHLEDGLFMEAGLRLLEDGKAEESVLTLMAEKLEAPIGVLLRLWSVCTEKKIPYQKLRERILEQALFSEVFPKEMEKLFSYFVEEEDVLLHQAFLNYSYYRFLLNDRLMGAFAERKLPAEALKGKSLLPVLAYLKFLSRKESLLTEEKEFAIVRLLRLVEEGIVLPFFKDFIGKCKVPSELENLKFACSYADNEDEISIHYKFELLGEEEGSSMVTEWMKNVYQGIFVKEFLIFADEKVKYYLSRSYEGEEVIEESGEIVIDPEELLEEDEKKSLYAEINHILLAKTLDDKKAVYEGMKRHILQKETLKDIFVFRGIEEEEKEGYAEG